MELSAIQELRQSMAANGWAPIPLLTNDKAVKISNWSNLAREDRSHFAQQPVRADMANTGFLCDGLRVVDIDIDDREYVLHVGRIAMRVLGERPMMRRRSNSHRLAFVYRAAEGAPSKMSVTGKHGKVEILGRGQQLHAFGLHPSGGELVWQPGAPGEIAVDDLQVVAVSQVDLFLQEVAELLEAQAPVQAQAPAAQPELRPITPAARELNIGYQQGQIDRDALQDAMRALPNDGRFDSWEAWNRVGMALWSATDGSAEGFALFDQWSQRHSTYDARKTRDRWDAITGSPPRDLHVGTIFWMARENGWKTTYESDRILDRPQRKTENIDPETGEVLGESIDDGLASRFIWIDPAKFPRRRFLYGTSYIRKFLSVDVAPGGVGKSSLALVELLAIASGKDLLGITPTETGCVWYHNGEDPLEEVDRRIIGAALHFEIEPAVLETRLFRSSGRDTHLVIAEQQREGAVILKPNVQAVIDTIRQHNILVARFDPFVSTHMVTENDNNAIAAVAREWAQIADITGASIALTHHSRKSNGNQTTIEDARGAVALIDASRSVRALNSMSEDEAAKAGVTTRRAYFRVDQGKVSMGPPADKAEWYHIASVQLPNGTAFEQGDSVGVVEPWEWPDPFAGISSDDAVRVQQAVSQGGPWREDVRAAAWVGHRVATVLGLDSKTPVEREKVKGLIRTWVKNGVLETHDGYDEKSNPRTFVRVGPAQPGLKEEA